MFSKIICETKLWDLMLHVMCQINFLKTIEIPKIHLMSETI
jgi:hypothetical protein